MKSISKLSKKDTTINTEIDKEVRKGWNEAFEQAISNGDIPEKDMFEALKNVFDDAEW